VYPIGSRLACYTPGMAGALARRGHRALLVGWRFLPLSLRKIAIRVLYPTFPVGAVAVIRDDEGRVLLVRQTYHRGECWGAPGGWLAGREHPRQTAAREAFEETGLRVRPGRVLAVDSGPYGEISFAFECAVVGDDGFRPSEEIDRIAYFPPHALPPLPGNTRRLLEEAVMAQDRFREARSPEVRR
jgi:ADP-ribose pyrophosphatase YjhB (NUDIX family)